MLNVKIKRSISPYEIEMKAREYGMEYKDEYKVIDKNQKSNTYNKEEKK